MLDYGLCKIKSRVVVDVDAPLPVRDNFFFFIRV